MADTYPEKYNKIKTNNQVTRKIMRAQALSFKSSARLSSGDNSYSK
jgi:hypothetical protein